MSPRLQRITLGLVADLHGRFDPLLPRVLAGVDRILVAGDIVEEALLGRLQEIAPVHAVRGNNDRRAALRALPEFLELEVAGSRILVAHDRKDRRLDAHIARARPDVLVVGHSHQPLVIRNGPLLVVNPGSAGPRRFHLPRTAGTLAIVEGQVPRVALWDLERDRSFPLPSYGRK